MNSFTQYVHEFEDGRGQTRYAVARWDEQHAQYVRPLDATERRLSGAYAEFARMPCGMQSYTSRTRALRRARYLFAHDTPEE
jgi:hypothetical protein